MESLMQAPAQQLLAMQPQEDQAWKPDLAKYRKRYTAFSANKSTEIEEQREARRYYHGKQWTDLERETLAKRRQPIVTDNRIGRKVDFLVGIEQRMRRDPKAVGRTPQHDPQADLVTAGVRYVCDVNRWENLASNGAHDGMVSGEGVAWVGIEQRRGKNEVVLKHIDVDRFFYDTRSTKPDFSDARWMGVQLWMDLDEAKEAWPEHAAKFDAVIDAGAGPGLDALAAEKDRAIQWADLENSRIRIVEFWEKRGKAWRYCKFSGDILIESGVSPYLNEDGEPDCPYVAWSPYIDEKGVRYGLIRNMKSMQDEINHRRSKFLHLLNSNKTYIRRGTVDDIDAFKQELAKPNAVIEHDGEWGKDTGIIDQTKEIMGQAELLTQAQSALENLGPNPGLIGKGGGVADQSGRAILAQRDSGMTELSPVFERLRDWKLRAHRKIWSCIRLAWTEERWIRVTDDPESRQFIGINTYQQDQNGYIVQDNAIAELDVDIILDEGADTLTMTEELLQRLSEIAQAPPQMWSILIELSNVPNKKRLLEMVQQATAPAQPAPPDPLQQEAQMQQLRANEADIGKKEAETARAYSDIETNRANAAAKMMQQEMARKEPREIGSYYQ